MEDEKGENFYWYHQMITHVIVKYLGYNRENLRITQQKWNKIQSYDNTKGVGSQYYDRKPFDFAIEDSWQRKRRTKQGQGARKREVRKRKIVWKK